MLKEQPLKVLQLYRKYNTDKRYTKVNQNGFTSKFYERCKEEILPILHTSSEILKWKEHFQTNMRPALPQNDNHTKVTKERKHNDVQGNKRKKKQ